MSETMQRRFSGRHQDWPTPDLLLIDGGKGQLGAALDALDAASVSIPAIGLAKRDEQIVVHVHRSHVTLDIDVIQRWGTDLSDDPSLMPLGGKALESKYVTVYTPDSRPGIEQSDEFILITLPKTSHIVKLLQRVRNESHRFAVSYHSTLKRKAATKSLLDDIPGIGPATRKKLMTSFGSAQGVKAADETNIAAVVGQKNAAMIYRWLHPSA